MRRGGREVGAGGQEKLSTCSAAAIQQLCDSRRLEVCSPGVAPCPHARTRP